MPLFSPSFPNHSLGLRATRFARSPGLARLLLKLYALAIIPVTLWVTGFASRLAVPLV